MKELKLEIPADYEVDKVETQEGHIVVTFKEKERKLPKSWEEFCEMFPIKDGESYIHSTGKIEEYLYHRNIPIYIKDKNILLTVPPPKQSSRCSSSSSCATPTTATGCRTGKMASKQNL